MNVYKWPIRSNYHFHFMVPKQNKKVFVHVATRSAKKANEHKKYEGQRLPPTWHDIIRFRSPRHTESKILQVHFY